MRKMKIAILSAIMLPSAAMTAPTTQFEDLDQLNASVALFLGDAPLGRASGAQPIDRRIRLARCPQPVALEQAVGAVTVRCAALGWRLRVPLSIAAGEASQIVVRRGDVVELSVAGVGFDLVTSATAIEDGSTGKFIRVKTSTGASIVSARVSGPGSVIAGN